jgi:hypothetical protein
MLARRRPDNSLDDRASPGLNGEPSGEAAPEPGVPGNGGPSNARAPSVREASAAGVATNNDEWDNTLKQLLTPISARENPITYLANVLRMFLLMIYPL